MYFIHQRFIQYKKPPGSSLPITRFLCPPGQHFSENKHFATNINFNVILHKKSQKEKTFLITVIKLSLNVFSDPLSFDIGV